MEMPFMKLAGPQGLSRNSVSFSVTSLVLRPATGLPAETEATYPRVYTRGPERGF